MSFDISLLNKIHKANVKNDAEANIGKPTIHIDYKGNFSISAIYFTWRNVAKASKTHEEEKKSIGITNDDKRNR